MLIDLVILASLQEGPRHGYEIKKSLENSLGRFLKLNNNLLYPALRRLEKQGALTCRVDSADKRPARRVYSITPAGEALLARLLEDVEPDGRHSAHAEFYVRVAFFHLIPPSARLRLLRARQRLLLSLMTHLEECLEHPKDPPRPYAQKLAAFSLERHQAELDWVERLIAEEKGNPTS